MACGKDDEADQANVMPSSLHLVDIHAQEPEELMPEQQQAAESKDSTWGQGTGQPLHAGGIRSIPILDNACAHPDGASIGLQARQVAPLDTHCCNLFA